jgi:hypothetical protein
MDDLEATPMRRQVLFATLVAVAVTLLGAPQRSGAQEGAAPAAGAVRLEPVPVEQVAREADRTLLQVNNQTPFIVFIYVGGVRIGWMRPYRTAVVRGMVNGYHTLYAHSQYGTMSWGPREAWIPGTWNLIY